MAVTRLKALLHVTSAKLDLQESDDFINNQMKFIFQCLKINNRSSENKVSKEDTRSDERIQLALKCLINLCSTSSRNELFFHSFESDEDRVRFTQWLWNLFVSNLDNDGELGHSARNLLCNLTRDTCWSTQLTEADPKTLLDPMFLTDATLVRSLPLLLNMTSQKEVRRRLCTIPSLRSRLLGLFLPLTDTVDQAILVAGVLKNCCFDDDYHLIWLAPQSKMLETLLLPLCGPEDAIDDEDRQKLPVGLQTVAGCSTAVRSDSNELKQTICEALLQLCATSDGRTRLRDCGVYFVLRELHKHETAKLTDYTEPEDAAKRVATNALLYHIEQVVDQLICEEHERDPDTVERSLRSLEIDPETSAKLSQAKVEFITAS